MFEVMQANAPDFIEERVAFTGKCANFEVFWSGRNLTCACSHSLYRREVCLLSRYGIWELPKRRWRASEEYLVTTRWTPFLKLVLKFLFFFVKRVHLFTCLTRFSIIQTVSPLGGLIGGIS